MRCSYCSCAGVVRRKEATKPWTLGDTLLYTILLPHRPNILVGGPARLLLLPVDLMKFALSRYLKVHSRLLCTRKLWAEFYSLTFIEISSKLRVCGTRYYKNHNKIRREQDGLLVANLDVPISKIGLKPLLSHDFH